jgi:hypothetical protein
MTAEELFWQLAAELRADDSRVVEGTIMNGRCLRVGNEAVRATRSGVPPATTRSEGKPHASAARSVCAAGRPPQTPVGTSGPNVRRLARSWMQCDDSSRC